MAQKPYDKATPEEAKYAQLFNEFVRSYKGNNWQRTLEGYYSDAGFDVPGISPVNITRVRELVTKKSIADLVRNAQPLYKLMPGAKTVDAAYLPGLIESAKKFFEEHPEAPAVKITGSNADYEIGPDSDYDFELPEPELTDADLNLPPLMEGDYDRDESSPSSEANDNKDPIPGPKIDDNPDASE